MRSLFTPNGALMRLTADSTGFDKPALWITNDGTAGSATGLRLDGPRPEIEFYETDQTSPEGLFELRVNNDKFQIGTRKADDSGFEHPYTFLRAADGGNFGIGTDVPDEKLHVSGNIKMEDGNEGLGKVLTSDANGVGSWKIASSGADNDWTIDGTTLYSAAE